MKSRLAKRWCFVGFSKVTETRKNSKPSQPLSLSRFIGAERGRTIDKTPPPCVGGGWAPRDDNIPLLIAIIPLCYGAFRDPMQWERCCFTRFVAFRRATGETTLCVWKYTINLHAHVLLQMCSHAFFGLAVAWNFIWRYQATRPKYFPHLVARSYAKLTRRNSINIINDTFLS